MGTVDLNQQSITRYDLARSALSEAKTLGEVMEIANKAAAFREYARRAKDRQMEADAIELRIGAERRLGQMLIEIKKTTGFYEGGRPVKKRVKLDDSKITLAEIGITYRLSSAGQALANMSDDQFGHLLEQRRNEILSGKRPKPVAIRPRKYLANDIDRYLRHDGVALRTLEMRHIASIARFLDAILCAHARFDGRAIVGSLFSDEQLRGLIKIAEQQS